MGVQATVVFTDLLKGVILGMIISIIFVLKGNLKRAYHFRKEEYHDEDCLIWVSHKEKTLKQICFTCEQERAIKEEAKRAKEQADREEELYTDDISRMLQRFARLNDEDQRSTGSKTQYKEKA